MRRSIFSSTPILRNPSGPVVARYKRKIPTENALGRDISLTQIHNAIYFNDTHSPAMVPDYEPYVFNVNRDIYDLINFVPSDEGSHQSQLWYTLFPPEFNTERLERFNETKRNLTGPDGMIPDPVLLVSAAMNSNHEQFTISGIQFTRNEALFEAMEVFLRAKEVIPASLWFAIGLTVPFLDGIKSTGNKKRYPIDCLKNAWIFRDNAHSSTAFETEAGALYLAHIGRALALQEFLDFNLPLEVQRKMAKDNNIKLQPGTDAERFVLTKKQDVPIVSLPMPESHCTHKIVMRDYDALTVFEKAFNTVAPHPVDSEQGQRSWFSNLFTARTVIKDEHAAGKLRASILRGAATVMEMRAARGLDLQEEEEQLNKRMKILSSTENDPSFIGVMRKFKNFRDGELYDEKELKQLADLQILDPLAEKQREKYLAQKNVLEDKSVWNADPLQPFGESKRNAKI